MSNANQKTIQAYEDHIEEYIQGTPQKVEGVVKAWLDAAISGVDKSAAILELGSGFGRDASYLKSLGFRNLICSDATAGFVKLLREQGHTAKSLNAISDPLGGPYRLILANAVLLHFTRTETENVLRKAFDALETGGILAFTLKQGDGEVWSDSKVGAPRYFCLWQADDLNQLLTDVGFKTIDISSNQKSTNATWLQVIAKK